MVLLEQILIVKQFQVNSLIMEEMKIAFFNLSALAINLTSINEELKFLSLALACVYTTISIIQKMRK